MRLNREIQRLKKSSPFYILQILLIKMKVLVALDRDGTINVDQGYTGKDPQWREKLQLCERVIDGIRKLKSDSKIDLCVVSNQAGVARGFVTLQRVDEVNDAINQLLLDAHIDLRFWYTCPYVDSQYAREKGLRLPCEWVDDNNEDRKPSIGMLRRAANDFGYSLEFYDRIYVIGDKPSDVQTALNAKGIGIIVREDDNQKEVEEVQRWNDRDEYRGRVKVAKDLEEAAKTILREIAN